MLRPLRHVFPPLSEALDRLSENNREALVRQVIIESADAFADVPEVAAVRTALAAGAPLSALDAAGLNARYEQYERRELEIDDAHGSERERERCFRCGRYLYALSLAPAGAAQIENLLYDMAHAFDHPDRFLQSTLQVAQTLDPTPD